MPQIKPFCAWRYNSRKLKDLSRVLAPPYDVISKKEQKRLYQANPYNVVRLILGQVRKSDTVRKNQYTRAASFLEAWQSSRILEKDSEPSLYVYQQDYHDEKGRLQSRLGFMAAMKLDEGAILKHENTLASPKKDRLALLKKVRTNLSPIFGLFEDKKAEIQKSLGETLQKTRPAIDVRIQRVRHRLYVENNPARIQKIQKAMRLKPMFIADGHHRFEVACQYKNWMQSRYPRDLEAPWHTVMTYFSDCQHNPFKIFPTHRLIRLTQKQSSPLIHLKRYGALQKKNSLAQVLGHLAKPRAEANVISYDFGIYTKREGFYIFKLSHLDTLQGAKNPVDKLDVAVLHKRILEPCFQIHQIEKSSRIDFTRNAKEACQSVRSGDFDIAFFLRPTSLGEMLEASKKGLKMPQKSTYFYPKLLSGLVFHSLIP